MSKFKIKPVRDSNTLRKFTFRIRDMYEKYSFDATAKAKDVMEAKQKIKEKLIGWKNMMIMHVEDELGNQYFGNKLITFKDEDTTKEVIEKTENTIKDRNAYEDMNDRCYSQTTPQGYSIIENYVDDDNKVYIIAKRPNDYMIAYDYQISDGTWKKSENGFDSIGMAQDALKKAVKDITRIFDAGIDSEEMARHELEKVKSEISQKEYQLNSYDKYDMQYGNAKSTDKIKAKLKAELNDLRRKYADLMSKWEYVLKDGLECDKDGENCAKIGAVLNGGLNVDNTIKDIQPTKETGMDKIKYVMQSDADKNLYFYIGEKYSMKEGAWTYQKYEMLGTSPEELKFDLKAHGWHEVDNGPAKVIDAHNARDVALAMSGILRRKTWLEKTKLNKATNQLAKIDYFDDNNFVGYTDESKTKILIIAFNGKRMTEDEFWKTVGKVYDSSKIVDTNTIYAPIVDKEPIDYNAQEAESILRRGVSAENSAIDEYEPWIMRLKELYNETEDERYLKAAKAIEDIDNEEKKHVGEFSQALTNFSPEEGKLAVEGMQEVQAEDAKKQLWELNSVEGKEQIAGTEEEAVKQYKQKHPTLRNEDITIKLIKQVEPWDYTSKLISENRDAKVDDDWYLKPADKSRFEKYMKKYEYGWDEIYDGINSRIKREGMKYEDAVEDVLEAMIRNQKLSDAKIDDDSVDDFCKRHNMSRKELEAYAKNNNQTIQQVIKGIESDKDDFHETMQHYQYDSAIKDSTYIIFRQNGKLMGTPEENYNLRIMNANKVTDFSKFTSAQQVIDYLRRYGYGNYDFKVIDSEPKDLVAGDVVEETTDPKESKEIPKPEPIKDSLDDNKLNAWLRALEKRMVEKYPENEQLHYKYRANYGLKYIKIIQQDYKGSRDESVWAFVDYDGNIYKAAGWNAPAKGVRATLENPPLEGAALYKRF